MSVDPKEVIEDRFDDVKVRHGDMGVLIYDPQTQFRYHISLLNLDNSIEIEHVCDQIERRRELKEIKENNILVKVSDEYTFEQWKNSLSGISMQTLGDAMDWFSSQNGYKDYVKAIHEEMRERRAEEHGY